MQVSVYAQPPVMLRLTKALSPELRPKPTKASRNGYCDALSLRRASRDCDCSAPRVPSDQLGHRLVRTRARYPDRCPLHRHRRRSFIHPRWSRPGLIRPGPRPAPVRTILPGVPWTRDGDDRRTPDHRQLLGSRQESGRRHRSVSRVASLPLLCVALARPGWAPTTRRSRWRIAMQGGKARTRSAPPRSIPGSARNYASLAPRRSSRGSARGPAVVWTSASSAQCTAGTIHSACKSFERGWAIHDRQTALFGGLQRSSPTARPGTRSSSSMKSTIGPATTSARRPPGLSDSSSGCFTTTIVAIPQPAMDSRTPG